MSSRPDLDRDTGQVRAKAHVAVAVVLWLFFSSFPGLVGVAVGIQRGADFLVGRGVSLPVPVPAKGLVHGLLLDG